MHALSIQNPAVQVSRIEKAEFSRMQDNGKGNQRAHSSHISTPIAYTSADLLMVPSLRSSGGVWVTCARGTRAWLSLEA